MRKRHSLKAAEGLHNVIKPDNPHSSAVLLQLLQILVQTPRREWFSYPFLRPKKNSSLHRRITNATPLLHHVQAAVNAWIERAFDLSFNLATKGQGVDKAIDEHKGGIMAFRFDLKSAYEFAAKDRLRFRFRQSVRKQTLPDAELDLLLDIITFDKSAPQGSTTSRNVYTIAVRPIHRSLMKMSQNPERAVRALSQYEDDFLMSFNAAHNSATRSRIERSISAQVGGAGFKIGRSQWYIKPPFEFLGTKIFSDRLEIIEEKESEILARVQAATASALPLSSLNSVRGLLTYVRRINGDGLTPELTKAFRDYYVKTNIEMPEWLRPRLPNF